MTTPHSKTAPLVRELTTGDVFILDRSVGELHLIDREFVEGWKSAGGDIKAARRLVEDGRGHTYTNAAIQKLQAALTHIQVLI